MSIYICMGKLKYMTVTLKMIITYRVINRHIILSAIICSSGVPFIYILTSINVNDQNLYDY